MRREVLDARLSTWPFAITLYGTLEDNARLLRLAHHFWHGGGANAPREARVTASARHPRLPASTEGGTL